MSKSIPNLKLNNGVEIPALGFGTFEKNDVAGQTHEAVLTALDAGYRHLDCAWFYKNEDEVGSALKQWLTANPAFKRSDIFITTKVWPHLLEDADIQWSLNNSLQMLGTDYVDCFLVHWPFACEKTEDNEVKLGPDGKYIIKEALTANPEPIWRTMEKLYTEGKARSIGVSNWTIPLLTSLLQYAKVPPAINQVEIHPFLPNDALIAFCRSNSILPVAYSPLGSQDQVPSTGEKVMTHATFRTLAADRGVSVAQLLIAWGLRRGYVVLPKSSNAERIRTNAQLMELSAEDYEAINQVARGRHTRFVDLKDTFGYDVWSDEASG